MDVSLLPFRLIEMKVVEGCQNGYEFHVAYKACDTDNGKKVEPKKTNIRFADEMENKFTIWALGVNDIL